MNTAILGSGGIGGFLASLLAKNGVPVTCVVKPGFEFADLHLSSPVFGNLKTTPRIAHVLDCPVGVLFVTTKSIDLREAIAKIPREQVKEAIIIPLLNGLGHAEILRNEFGPCIAVGMIGAIEAKSEKPGYVTHVSKTVPVLELASSNVSKGRLESIAVMLRDAGITVHVLDSEAEVIWNKLVRLNAIASVTAAAQKPLGAVRADSFWRPLLMGAVEEAAMVAKKEGANLDPRAVLEQIDALPAELTTSLQRDVENGLPSEVETIPGGVLQKAAAYHISCPSIEALYQKIKSYE